MRNDEGYQAELEVERYARSLDAILWARAHGMPGDMIAHLLFECGLSDGLRRVEVARHDAATV